MNGWKRNLCRRRHPFQMKLVSSAETEDQVLTLDHLCAQAANGSAIGRIHPQDWFLVETIEDGVYFSTDKP